jgi:heptosyltransferase-3
MKREPQKILVFAKPAIGDILLATPLIRSIREATTDATIDLMCYPGQEGIVEGNPDIDNVVVVDQKPSTRELFNLAKNLFRKYDIAITNAADDRVHLYLLIFGKTRVSVATREGAAWKRWITKACVEDNPDNLHALLRNNQLGNKLGFKSDYRIRVPVSADRSVPSSEFAAVLKYGKPYAVVHPDARLPYKRWTVAGWRALLSFFDARGMRTYITGGPSETERNYVQDMLRNAPPSASSLAGKLRFSEVGELIRKSRIYVGVDTVNSHLSAATGAPTIALFGPESPVRWGPWPKGYATDASPWLPSGTQRKHNVLIIQGKTDCYTCKQGGCRRRHDHGVGCPLMTGISTEQVIEGVRAMLN